MNPEPTKPPQLLPSRLKHTLTIGLLSGLTLVLGFAVQVLLAARLGAGIEMDIFLVAVGLPTLITNVSVSAFGLALVPPFTEAMSLGSVSAGLALVKRLAARMAPLSLSLGFLLIIGARPIVRVLAPGFDVPATDGAAGLLRAMSLGSVLDLFRGLLAPFYYARERFFLPQAAPIFNHIAMIASVLVLLPRMGLQGLALGWVAGSGLMLVPLLVGIGSNRRPPHGDRSPRADLARIRSLLWASVITVISAQAIPVIDRAVATALPQGSVTYLGYGYKLLEVLLRTAPMSIVLAAFPRMSLFASMGDRDEVQREVSSALRWILFTGVPLSAWVVIMRYPLVRTLFERGAFDQLASVGVATAVGWYAFSFIPASIGYLFQLVIFSLRRGKVLIFLAGASIAMTAVFDYGLSRIWGFQGIAATSVLVSATWALMAALVVARWLPSRGQFPGLMWSSKVGLAGVVSGAAVSGAKAILSAGPFAQVAGGVVLTGTAATGLLSYLGVLWIGGIPEMTIVRLRLTHALRELTSRLGA